MPDKKNAKKSRLIQLICTLSKLEMKRLGRFLQSPYVNTNSDIILLFELIKKYYPDFSVTKFNEEKIHQRIYGKIPFRKEKIQDLFSKLLRMVESYLLDAYLEKHQQQREVLLTAALGERHYVYHQQKMNKLTTTLKAKKEWRTETDYYQLFQLSHNAWYHSKTEKLTADHSLLVASQDYLDNAYLLRKLEFMASLSGRAKFLNTQSETLLAALKGNFMESTLPLKNEYELLFKKVIQLHESENLANYHAFKVHLLKIYPKLTRDYQKNFLLHLINFAINFSLQDEAIPIEEIFELYKIGVSEQIFLNNGQIRDTEFTNICITGFKLGYVEWVTAFIESHQQYLQESERIYLLPFVKAYHKLFTKDFEEVIKLLRNIKPKQHLKYHSRIQSLLIRAFFECKLHNIGHYEHVLTSYLNNLKLLMERNSKNTALKIDAHLNFIRFVKKLISLLDHPFEEKIFTETKLLLETTKPLILKSWLIEKLMDIYKATFKKDLKAAL